jgi:hypothetical protein
VRQAETRFETSVDKTFVRLHFNGKKLGVVVHACHLNEWQEA